MRRCHAGPRRFARDLLPRWSPRPLGCGAGNWRMVQKRGGGGGKRCLAPKRALRFFFPLLFLLAHGPWLDLGPSLPYSAVTEAPAACTAGVFVAVAVSRSNLLLERPRVRVNSHSVHSDRGGLLLPDRRRQFFTRLPRLCAAPVTTTDHEKLPI